MKEYQAEGGCKSARRGPKPLLSTELESDIVEWIGGMQRAGLPPSRREILHKANAAVKQVRPPSTRSTPFKPISTGWYRRFRERHPELSDRRAQVIARVRNNVTKESVESLFHTLLQLIVELKIDAERVFNMDETAFMPDSKARTVVAVKGFTCVWTRETKTSFHMTVAAAVSAAGKAAPPLIIVPGVRLQKEELRAISLPGSRVSGAPKGFSNTALFQLWLQFFADHLAERNVAFPVVLVLDNSSTHLDIGSLDLAVDLGIFLVPLPPNATHLYQPLDVAVFKPYKSAIRTGLQDLLATSSECTVSKSTTIKLACEAYTTAIIEKPGNAVSGFRCTGIFPLNLVHMKQRLQLSRSGGVKGDIGVASWLKRAQHQIRENVLTLPPSASRNKKQRVTVDIAGRLVGAADADD